MKRPEEVFTEQELKDIVDLLEEGYAFIEEKLYDQADAPYFRDLVDRTRAYLALAEKEE